MSYRRQHFTAFELQARAPESASWPVVSLGLLCVLAPVLSAGVLTVINLYLLSLAALVLLASRQPPPRELMLALTPFFALAVIAIMRGVGAESYAFLRDGWYLTNPAMVIAVGFVLGHHVGDPARGLRAFVVGGAAVALLHLSIFLRFPELLSLRAIDVRTYVGTGYFAPVLSALIVLGHWGHWRTELRLSPWVAVVVLLIDAASIVLAYSRTLTLIFLVGALAVGGFFERRVLWRVAVLTLVALAAVLAVRTVIDPASKEARTTQIGKFGRVFEELSITERISRSDIDDNWRGYETARALGQWYAGGPLRWLFGEGLGATVDLGMFQTFTHDRRDAVRFIPVFHNGYMFVLVKTGLVGVVIYLGLLARLYWIGRRRVAVEASPTSRLGRMMQNCAVTLALSTAIWFGAFHKFDLLPVLLMVGFLLSQLPSRGLAARQWPQ